MSGLSSLFSFTSGSSASPASSTLPSTNGSNSTPVSAGVSSNSAASPAMSGMPAATMSTATLSSNPRYRAFSDALSLCLEEFDRPAEWADLISALQKVSKVLTNKRFTPGMAEGVTLHVIPHTVAINLAKRLAQCLNSGLPGGVHLKALEVYELVLDRLGPSGLIPSLSIWSMGLFPLFQAASSRVKPILLELIEKHYVPLGKSLLPALPGIIMALLPGMEEESGESHKKCFEILEKIRLATDNKTFMRCVWRALLTSSHIRLAALNYLSSMLPKPTALIPASSSNSSTAITPASGTPSNATATPQLQLSRFISSPPSLSIHALLATLHSRDNILTQRRVLELIGSHFPLREGNLQKDINSSPTLTSTSRSSSIQSMPLLPPAATLEAPPTSVSLLISPSASNSSSVPLGSVLTIDEQVDLLSGALDILLLNDASLNRRMFAWILGSASQKDPNSNNATTAASPHALLPMQSLHFLYASFLRIFRQVMPDFEEDASSPNVPTFASNVTIHMLLRPFQLLNVLLDRDEILHSPLLQLLHPLLLRFWYEVHELLSQLDHDTTSAMSAASQADGGSNKTGANAATENKLFIKPRRGSHPQNRFRKPGGSSSSVGGSSSANSVTSATDHLYAFYAQIPCASLWEYLFTQISRAQTNVSTLIHSAASASSSSSSSSQEEEPASLETDSEAIRAASQSLDFQIKLLEFACEVLPIQAPVPPTPSSAGSSVPPTPSSMAVTISGNGVTPSPAAVISPFKTPIASVSASPEVSYFDSSLSDPTAAFMLLFRSIDCFAAVRAYPYLVFALSTFLNKFLLRFMMHVQSHPDEQQEQFNALPTSLVQVLMQRLHFLLQSVQPAAANVEASFDSPLWFQIFDEEYLDESRLESMHLLFQFYHTCLSVLEDDSAGINEFSLPLLSNALHRSRSNSQSRNHTPSRSVPPSATPSVPPSPVLISSKLQGKKNLSIDASIEALQPPSLIRCSSTSSQLHVQCLQQYHEELFRSLHAVSIDESIIGLTHWMSLAETYGDVLFGIGDTSNGTGTKQQVFSFLLKKLWYLLHDSFAHVHREVGVLFYRFLQVELRLAEVEAADEINHADHSIESIAELVLLVSNSNASIGAYAKLMRLWRMMCELDNQSKSASARVATSLPPLPLQPWLWILLDVLSSSHQSSHVISSPQLQLLTREWLGDSLQQHLDRIFDPFFTVLLHQHTIRTVAASSDGLPVYMHLFDVRQVLYTLEQLQTVLELDNGFCMEILMRRKPSTDVMRLFQLHASAAGGVTSSSNSTQTSFATDAPLWTNPRSYLHLLSVTLLKFLQSGFPPSLFDDKNSVLDIAEEYLEQNRRIRCLASELLLFITSHIPVASVSIQLCTVFTPQILLALAQATGVKHRTQQQQQSRPALAESSSTLLDTDPIVQYHLLRLLRVLLAECNRRVDFTEHAQSVQPAHSVLAHALFLQTIIAGIKAATLVHNDVGLASSSKPESSPSAKSQPQRYFGDSVPDTIPPAKVTIASLSLLPASVKTLVIRASNHQRTKRTTPTTSVATLSHWVSFLLTTMPLLRQALPNFVAAIVGTMCGELQRVTSELKGIIPVSVLAVASIVSDGSSRPSSAPVLSSRKTSVAGGLGSGAHRFASKHLPTPSPGGRGSINRKNTGSSRASVSGNFPSPTSSPVFTSKDAKDNPTFSSMELTENANRLASHAALAAACMTLLDGLRSVITYCLTRETATSTPAASGPFQTPAASASPSNPTSDLEGIAMTEVSPAHSSPSSNHSFASQTTEPAANGTATSSSEKSDSIAGSMLSSLTSVFSSTTTKNPVIKPRVVIGFEVHTIEGIYALMPAILDALLTVLALPLPHESANVSRYDQSGEKYAPASSTPSSSRENSWPSSRSSLLPSSRNHWAQFHESLHLSSRSFIEDLLTRNASKTIHAIEVIWERGLFELVQSKAQPVDLPSYLQGLNSSDELSAQCAASHLAASHHLILRLLNSLPFNVGSPEILIGCLVPLTINAITKATPHARKTKASASALTPSLSAFASPLSNSTNAQSPSNAAMDGIAGANSAPAAAGAAQVTVVSSLSDSEFGFLHFTHSVLKYSKHTNVLPHLWLNKNSSVNTSSTSAATSTVSSNGSLSQMFTSAQLHACDHPLVLLWFISIMHTWILRSNIFHGGSSASTSNAANPSGSVNASSNASTAPAAKSVGSANVNANSKPDLGSLSEPLALDKKLIREIQGSISSLLTSTAGLVGDNMEMMVEPCKNFLGVSLALMPPSIYFIAPRDELNDLLPPLSPWLQAVVHMNKASNTGANSGPTLSKYPSWPHLQVTVPRNSAEFNHILSQAVPVATSSLLHPLDSVAAHYGSSQNSVKKTSVSLSLITLRCFSNILASFLTEAFAFTPLAPPLLQSTLTLAQIRTESEAKAIGLLQGLFPIFFPVLHQSHHPLNLPYLTPIVSLVASLSIPALTFTVKSWKNSVWEYFFHSNEINPSVVLAACVAAAANSSTALASSGNSASPANLAPMNYESFQSFFSTDIVTLDQFRWIISRIISEEKHLLSSFFALDRTALNLESFATQLGGAASNLFSSKENELSQRRNNLKKLSFILHAGRKDQYSRHLSAILERIIENLKIVPPAPISSNSAATAAAALNSDSEYSLTRSILALHSQVFICLRVLLARVSSEHLTSLWPIVLMELIRIFEHSKQGLHADAQLLCQACKFIDIAIVILPAQFNLYAWMFVKDAVQDYLSSILKSPSTSALPSSSPVASPSNALRFEPHAQHLDEHATVKSKKLAAPASANSNASATQSSNLIRPVLLQRHVSSLAELSTFHSRLSHALNESFQRPQAEPDYAFVDSLLLSDFVDYPEQNPAVLSSIRQREQRQLQPPSIPTISTAANSAHDAGKSGLSVNTATSPSTAGTPGSKPSSIASASSATAAARKPPVHSSTSAVGVVASGGTPSAAPSASTPHDSSNTPSRRTAATNNQSTSNSPSKPNMPTSARSNSMALRGAAPSADAVRPPAPFTQFSSLVQPRSIIIPIQPKASK